MKTFSYFGYIFIFTNVVLFFIGWWWLFLSLPVTIFCYRKNWLFMHWIPSKPPVVKKEVFLATVKYSEYCASLNYNIIGQWWASRHLTIKKFLTTRERLIFLATLDLISIYIKNGGSRTDLYNEQGANLLILVDMLYRNYMEKETNTDLSVVHLRTIYSLYYKNVLSVISTFDTIKENNSEYDVENNGYYRQVVDNANKSYAYSLELFFEAADAILKENNQIKDFEDRKKSQYYEWSSEDDKLFDDDDSFDDGESLEEEGDADDPYDLGNTGGPVVNDGFSNMKVSIEDVMKELNGLTGLETVKEEIQTFINTIKVQNQKRAMHLPIQELSYHCVFTGSPGTGKTTVARILAKAFKSLGLISKGQLIEASRKDLVAGYLGQTSIKTNQLLDRAKGNVLFIDEAYQLVSRDDDSFGQEAVAELIARMENDRNDLIVIIAGYDKEITAFLSSNPGLKSRFNRYIHFEDYNAMDLAKIFYSMAKGKSYKMSEEVIDRLKALTEQAYNRRGKDFGNARYVRNFFEKCIEEQANRLSSITSPTKDDLITFNEEDLLRAFRKVNV